MVTHASSSPEVHNSGRLTIICFMKFHQISSITIFTTPTINIYLYNPHGTGGVPWPHTPEPDWKNTLCSTVN